MRTAMFVAALVGAAGAASADTMTVDISGETYGDFTNALNTVINVSFNEGDVITGFSWTDVFIDVLTPGNGSWAQEASLAVSDSGLGQAAGFTFEQPATTQNENATVSGSVDLATDFVDGAGNPVDARITIGADGILRLELWENFDDVAFDPNAPTQLDAIISGSVTIEFDAVPAPASAALLGLGGLVATRRRR